MKVSGTLSAAGKKTGTTGGTILVTGEDIKFVGALVDASGRAGGGKVMIGGDWGGGKPASGLVNNQSAKLENFAIPTATTVSVDAGTTINASATESGQRRQGDPVVGSTRPASPAPSSRAAARSRGNGGFVETSSKKLLNFTGTVDTRAPNGAVGTLLLDPRELLHQCSWASPPGRSDGLRDLSKCARRSQLEHEQRRDCDRRQGSNAGDICVRASCAGRATTP